MIDTPTVPSNTEPPRPERKNHSWRSAIIRSTREVRRAGPAGEHCDEFQYERAGNEPGDQGLLAIASFIIHYRSWHGARVNPNGPDRGGFATLSKNAKCPPLGHRRTVAILSSNWLATLPGSPRPASKNVKSSSHVLAGNVRSQT